MSASGCNLVGTRLSTVGRDGSVPALATGSWDTVAKLEAMLTRLERAEGLKLIWYRTGPKPVQSNLLPYIVEVVASRSDVHTSELQPLMRIPCAVLRLTQKNYTTSQTQSHLQY